MTARSLFLGSLAAAALAAGTVVSATPAGAAAIITVDDDGHAAPGKCGATTPAPRTIQGGVDAATAGDTVRVCPGTYVEYVTVNKPLVLKAAQAGVDGRTRNTSVESVVDPDDSATAPTFTVNVSNVTLDGFRLVGNENGPAVSTVSAESGYRILNNRITANALGIVLGSSGANPTVVQRNAIAANNEQFGVVSAAGNGIYSDTGLSGVLVSANAFRNNINSGVIIAGPAQGITASGNSSTADGSFFQVQSGLGSRSGVRIINNRVNLSNGSGVFFTDASGITVQGNRIFRSTFSGVRISSDVSGASIVGNTANGNGDQGISVSSEVPGAATVRSNTTNNNQGDGILFGAGTRSNIIKLNKAGGNGNFDCEDQSRGTGTRGTANTWSSNTGVTSSPVRICRP